MNSEATTLKNANASLTPWIRQKSTPPCMEENENSKLREGREREKERERREKTKKNFIPNTEQKCLK